MGNKVVHFEVSGPDGAVLRTFYADLFGWHIQEYPELQYGLVDTHGGGGINGGIGQPPDGTAFSTFYVGADDPQALLDEAVSKGATVVLPVTELPMVTMALFSDPDGLVVGIVKNAPPDQPAPGPSDGSNPKVDWFEILGPDGPKTQAWYSELFGWKVDVTPDFPGYGQVEPADAGIGGGLGAGEGSRWVTSYAHVPDVEASLTKAEELGGKRVYGPNDMGPIVAGAFHDPAGNVFGVYSSKS